MNKLVSIASVATATMIFLPQAQAVGQGEPMPACEAKMFHTAQPLPLKSQPGKVLYIDFWASWCGPCAKSFPFLNDLNQELKANGLEIMGVNLDENSEDAKDFLAKYPANFTILGDVAEQCAKQFDVKAMPSSYLVDKKGIVRAVHLGFKADEAETIKNLVIELLAEK